MNKGTLPPGGADEMWDSGQRLEEHAWLASIVVNRPTRPTRPTRALSRSVHSSCKIGSVCLVDRRDRQVPIKGFFLGSGRVRGAGTVVAAPMHHQYRSAKSLFRILR